MFIKSLFRFRWPSIAIVGLLYSPALLSAPPPPGPGGPPPGHGDWVVPFALDALRALGDPYPYRPPAGPPPRHYGPPPPDPYYGPPGGHPPPDPYYGPHYPPPW